MPGPPTTRRVLCPSCESTAYAVVPSDSTVVRGAGETDADGKVQATCHSCEERFTVYYRDDD